jgi:hypothetical protein
MAKIQKFKNFAKKMKWAWDQDTPTEIILPDYQTEVAEKEAEEIENNIENNEIEESLLTNSSITFTNKRNPRLQGHEWRHIFPNKFK